VSFSGTLFVLVLALVVFGPKKSMEIAQQVGRVIGELKRVSSRFQSQVEDELQTPKIAARAQIEPPISTIEQTEINFG
jgi:Sec-independent protein translocase protein TatA